MFLSVLAYPGSPGQKAVKRLCVCVLSTDTDNSFDTVGWASGKATGLYKLSDWVFMWLSVCSDVQIVCIWSS